jgi:ribosomal protein L11 methyltransferase
MSAGGAGWRVDFPFPAEALPALDDALAPLGGALVTGGPDAKGLVPVTLYLAAEPDRAALTAALSLAALTGGCKGGAPDFTAQALPPTDWVAESQKSLSPIHAGRVYIRGSHVTEEPPAGSIALLIEANQAFGTGRHETTRGCLLALQDLHRRGLAYESALDMGCGSGVLAMAMARLWSRPVVAVDNDAASIRVARENLRLNGLSGWVRAEVSEGYAGAAVREGAPYDLIVANILAGPLCEMAEELRRHLAPGGYAILSGLLARQEREVRQRHRAAGLVLVRRFPLGEWTTLVLRRRT